ncbi:MAG TPA: hypothetical protein VNU01_08400, partial [Egibacteraceae bacterium]|nr:hypothetical protein [Egibacteraceae bacterium]
MKLRTRGRAALGALAIVLISASMPAGAGVIPDEVDFVDDYVDLYDEENREADTPGLGIGWAIARLDVADVALSNLVDRGELRANTGDIRTTVTTVGQPYSELMFNPHRMFNDVVPPWNPKRRGLNSDPEQGTYRAVLEHPQVPDVEGLLGIGRYYVQSNAKGSFAEVGSASGWMRAKRFGLVSDMGDKGLVSAVTNEAAGAKVALTVEDFQINLNDVFQQEAVELPLGMTLDIATAVSLPGGHTAQKAYERLKEFEQELGVLNGLAEDLAFLRAELEPYAAAMPGYAEAEAAVEAAEAQLAEARATAKAAAEEVVRLVAENEALNTAINSVNTMLAAVTQDIAMLQGHIDALNTQIADTVE